METARREMLGLDLILDLINISQAIFSATVCLSLTDFLVDMNVKHVLKYSAESLLRRSALHEIKAVGFFKPLDSPFAIS